MRSDLGELHVSASTHSAIYQPDHRSEDDTPSIHPPTAEVQLDEAAARPGKQWMKGKEVLYCTSQRTRHPHKAFISSHIHTYPPVSPLWQISHPPFDLTNEHTASSPVLCHKTCLSLLPHSRAHPWHLISTAQILVSKVSKTRIPNQTTTPYFS